MSVYLPALASQITNSEKLQMVWIGCSEASNNLAAQRVTAKLLGLSSLLLTNFWNRYCYSKHPLLDKSLAKACGLPQFDLTELTDDDTVKHLCILAPGIEQASQQP